MVLKQDWSPSLGNSEIYKMKYVSYLLREISFESYVVDRGSALAVALCPCNQTGTTQFELPCFFLFERSLEQLPYHYAFPALLNSIS